MIKKAAYMLVLMISICMFPDKLLAQAMEYSTIEIYPQIEDTDIYGTEYVDVSEKEILQGVKDAIKQEKEAKTKDKNVFIKTQIVIKPQVSRAVKGIAVRIPKSAWQNIVYEEIDLLTIQTDFINISMDYEAQKEIRNNSSGYITIFATKEGIKQIPSKIMTKYNNRPIYNIMIKTEGRWIDKLNNSISVSIPYAQKKINGKTERGGNIIALQAIDGKFTKDVLMSSYIAKEKRVIFQINELGIYGISYKEKIPVYKDTQSLSNKGDIDYILARGLLEFKGKTEFAPRSGITRADLVMALGRLSNEEVSIYKDNTYKDVKEDSIYRPYIEWANKLEIIKGRFDQTIRPDEELTREEFYTILYNYMNAKQIILPTRHVDLSFSDVIQNNSVQEKAIKKMNQIGIITGSGSVSVLPKEKATRSWACEVLRQFVELTVGSGMEW